MNLIISAELTAPPSEVGAFRTLTLYATVFKELNCLVESHRHEIDYYYRWLKNTYSYDYVKEMVYIGEERGIHIKHNQIDNRLTYDNLNKYITILY